MATPAQHALLGPSGASRWLACTPSARLEADLPDTTSAAAAEGTLAHEIGELMTAQKVGDITKRTCTLRLNKLKKHDLFQNEMLEYCENYSAFIMERFNEARVNTPDAILELEQVVDLSAYVPESFGTVDNTIIADGLMSITDLKYGKGVQVSAEDNAQLKLYALGCLEKYDLAYEIDNVRMTIYQPRLDNISSVTMSVEELREWGETIRPKAKMAFAGEGELVTGDHCRFCKVGATCRKRAEESMELARADFAIPPQLTDEEIEALLPELDKMMKWAKDLQKYAFDKALDGHSWEGFKLVAGRSTRCYADEAKILAALKELGYTENDLQNYKLKGLTDMGKLVGKQVMSDLEIQGLIIKPEGKPTLVPASDKRPEIQSKTSAAEDFAEELEELV